MLHFGACMQYDVCKPSLRLGTDAFCQFLHSNYKIVGDFNQDLIKYDDNLDCQNLIDNAHNHGFVQLESRPTRITDHSATLIDHV